MIAHFIVQIQRTYRVRFRKNQAYKFTRRDSLLLLFTSTSRSMHQIEDRLLVVSVAEPTATFW